MLVFLSTLLLGVIGKMNVYMVPHSHNDAGWLETAEWYYENKVQYTLDNMLDLLDIRDDVKFVWAEIYYLARYLSDFPNRKAQVIEFNKQGRFEIVGGGWVQHDEATVDFEMAIRQTEAGFEYISRELGINNVKIGWQLDPFGHSSLTAALFDKMGLEVLVFSRIEDSYRLQLQNSSNMEFIWKPQGLGSKKGVFTHVLNDHYYSPGFLTQLPWETQCYGELPANETGVLNCIQAVEEFVYETSYKYKTNHQLMLIGADFYFTDRNFTFQFMDLLARVSAQSTNMNIKIATASEYFDAVLASETSFEVFGGDLLPLVSPGYKGQTSYWWKPWTGFYSNKPHIKQVMYDTQKLARVAEIVKTGWRNEKIMAYELDMCTHHDAITGTMREPVYYDYLQRLENDQQMLLNQLGLDINSIMTKQSSSNSQLMVPYKVLFIINPLNWPVQKTLSFEASSEFVRIFDTTNQTIPSQTVPYLNNYKAYFVYTLQGLEIRTLFVSEYANQCSDCSTISQKNTNQVIGNQYITIGLDNGLLTSLKTQKNEFFIAGKIVRYDTYMSGCYTFVETEPAEIICTLEEFYHYTGPVVEVAESYFSHGKDTFIQRIIVDKISDNFIMTFYVYAERNDDIFYRFYQIYDRTGWFYTFNTANLQKRYFDFNTLNKTGHNYYPITGGLVVDLDKEFMYIMPTFALGAGMPFENVFELGLHRHPSYDDGLGVDYYSGDIFPVEHHWMIGFSSLDYNSIWSRFLEYRSSPIVFFNTLNDSLTLNFTLAAEYTSTPEYQPNYIFLNNFDCAYLSSLVSRNGSYVFRVLNKCDHQIKVDFKNEYHEINAGGLPLTEYKAFDESGKLELNTYNNSWKNVMEYPHSSETDGIRPYELKTYMVHATGVMSKDIMTEKINKGEDSAVMTVLALASVVGVMVAVGALIKYRKGKKFNEEKGLKGEFLEN
ncbi:hypothetical protein SteCoe_18876 [Stentor coeruleus]|uniref:Glycoside hydrolase family 38 central domain-containing protein n=1 Tax=Stentor coeruleus TaxID=5963 RepID=A0A1R2BVB6_9CILI|nr:hypothetical protein SteCoe_18876 [Stentor coeruleus]